MATAKITIKSQILLDHIQKLMDDKYTAKSMIIEKALVELDKKIAFNKFNNAYLKLKKEPEAWKNELNEREELDGTLMDGLTDDES